MKTGIAMKSRKNTVSLDRWRSSSRVRPIGWCTGALLAGSASDIVCLLELEAATARERRVAAGEQEHVRVRLRLVAQAVRHQVAHSSRHAAERERREPADQRDDLEHDAE